MNNIDLSKIKLTIKINLIGDKEVELSLVSISKECMATGKDNDSKFFKDPKINFAVWSKGKFLLDYRQLRLPELGDINNGTVTYYKFDNDMERRKTLLKMYITLNKWSNLLFHVEEEDNVILDKEYWYIQ